MGGVEAAAGVLADVAVARADQRAELGVEALLAAGLGVGRRLEQGGGRLVRVGLAGGGRRQRDGRQRQAGRRDLRRRRGRRLLHGEQRLLGRRRVFGPRRRREELGKAVALGVRRSPLSRLVRRRHAGVARERVGQLARHGQRGEGRSWGRRSGRLSAVAFGGRRTSRRKRKRAQAAGIWGAERRGEEQRRPLGRRAIVRAGVSGPAQAVALAMHAIDGRHASQRRCRRRLHRCGLATAERENKKTRRWNSRQAAPPRARERLGRVRVSRGEPAFVARANRSRVRGLQGADFFLINTASESRRSVGSAEAALLLSLSSRPRSVGWPADAKVGDSR